MTSSGEVAGYLKKTLVLYNQGFQTALHVEVCLKCCIL